ncbi:response regulator transcription factor [Tateyamaria sp. ANG-S1]|uniref:response regulator n=1 Tax=Tateyamaria sp. ANG-S1 TaxID=1577905 RepID=UPI00057F85CD|nr:response regulator transcription factor [Tateyamaria sp. ANG-S1]KIC51115.1 transcriptional regulatory protein AruR [Tateyamaria sp. ANG-S1]
MDQRPSTLVVEDDPKVRAVLRNLLEDDGFQVMEATSAAETLECIAAQDLSLVTLDIHLGAESGLDLARQIRKLSTVPMVMVTGKDDLIDRIVGLEVGADDYITKPFHVREVIARIRAVLRRHQFAEEDAHRSRPAAREPMGSTAYHFDGVIAIPDHMQVIDRAGSDCQLTSGDFNLLNVFLERPMRVLSRDQLMDLTHGATWSPLDRTVDNQIARLRKKIERNPSEPRLIKTVRGVGYTFACPVERKALAATYYNRA